MQAKLTAVLKYSLGPFALKLTPFELEVPLRKQGRIGLHVQNLSEDLARALGAVDGKAIDVGQVLHNCPAQKAGVRRGDIIVELDGKPTHDAKAFARSIKAMAPRTKVKLAYIRNGKRAEVEVIVGDG